MHYWRNPDEESELEDLYSITLDPAILARINALRAARGMPEREEFITIFDIICQKLGSKESYSAQDFDDLGLPFFAGCQYCQESLGPGNAYPSKSGYIRCQSCLNQSGYRSVREFDDDNSAENIDASDLDD